MIHHEPWVSGKTATRSEDIQRAYRDQDWPRLLNLLERSGISIENIILDRLDQALPTGYTRPFIPSEPHTGNRIVDIQWDELNHDSTHDPNYHLSDSGVFFKGKSDIDLIVKVGEEALEWVEEQRFNQPDPWDLLIGMDVPTTEREWEGVGKASLYDQWKYGPSPLDLKPVGKIKLLHPPTPRPSPTLEVQYDQHYPTHWAVKFQVEWAGFIAWESLLP